MSEKGNVELLHDAPAVAAAIEQLAAAIEPEARAAQSVAIVGVRTRGLTIAERLRPLLEERLGHPVLFGILDITLYRDDLSNLGAQPVVGGTELPFDVDGCTVFLIDDVIYTGRTTRAALEALIAFGRPAAIRLVTPVDRGHREYPVQPDHTAFRIETTRDQVIHVRLNGVDSMEGIQLVTR